MIVTAQEFKTQFPRFTPVYLPVYVAETTYYKDDVVYYVGKFYKVKVAYTTNIPTNTTDWEVTQGNVLNYTQDSDITNAIAEAAVNFNEGLFDNATEAKLIFLYLVAYYLTVDFQNAANANGGFGLVQSKSVGSVSESYAIPQFFLNKPQFALYAQNGYGRKYLSMILPYLTGNIILARGRTTFD